MRRKQVYFALMQKTRNALISLQITSLKELSNAFLDRQLSRVPWVLQS